jgi:peptidoglycan/LPS O-acetylase OafA/YrhL
MQITTSRNPEIPALTGIRALAAWWVALYHIKDGLAVLYPGLAGTIYAAVWAGDLGVDLFFILSGFVIAYNYWPRFLVFRATEYRHFLWMRLARIYPVHVVTLLGVLALYLGSKVLHVHINTDVTNWTASTFVHNLLLIHQWVPHAEASWNGPAWSISCEWLAYLFFPAVVLVTAARGNASVAGSTAFLSLLTLGIFYQSGHDNRIVRIALEFPAGCMIYCLFRVATLPGNAPPRSSRPPFSALLAYC